jgi:iron(III) transport system substrate-binding protein
MTLDQELALAPGLVEAAQREGKVNFISSIDKDVIAQLFGPFSKRYPGIEFQYQQASEEVRTVRTLTEFKAGRTSVDVVMSIGGFITEYKAAKALTSLSDLPTFALYEPPYRDPDGEWLGWRTQFWGVGYNTANVKDSEVPQTWDDLTDPKWQGRLGLGDRPQLWAEQRWKDWGADRTTVFLKKLFANQPQRRKEGLDASANLLAAGEFDLYLPTAPYRAEGLRKQGATIAWSSPEPLSVNVSEVAILQRTPNPNAARVFANWFLSREAQALYSKADNATPAHPALRTDRQYLGMFADSLLGRAWSMQEPEDDAYVLPQVQTLWRQLWTS